MQIVMINAHWNNRGDEAAIRAIVDEILLHHPKVKLTIIFKDKKDISQFPYQGVIDYFVSGFLIEEADMKQVLACEDDQIPEHLLPVMHAIRKADGVIYAPGGAVISDRFWWKSSWSICSLLHMRKSCIFRLYLQHHRSDRFLFREITVQKS